MYSIVICSYNKAKSLSAVLKNLDNISEASRGIYFEVIVVVDGSTDNTMQVLENISVRYPLRYYYIANGGLSAARNYGIEKSTQKYVVFCDDDVLFHSNYLPALHEAISNYPDCVHIGNLFNVHKDCTNRILNNVNAGEQSDFQYMDEHFQYHVFFDAAKKLFQNQESYEVYKTPIWWAVVTGGNLCIPKKYFDQCGVFDSHIKGWGPEDADLCYRFFKKGVTARFNSECVLYHLDHDRNNTTLVASMMRNAIYFIKKYSKPPELYDYLNFANGNLSLIEFNERVSKLYGFEKIVIPEFSMSMKDYSGQEQIL